MATRKALRPARGTLDDALAYHCGALISANREERPHTVLRNRATPRLAPA